MVQQLTEKVHTVPERLSAAFARVLAGRSARRLRRGFGSTSSTEGRGLGADALRAALGQLAYLRVLAVLDTSRRLLHFVFSSARALRGGLALCGNWRQRR